VKWQRNDSFRGHPHTCCNKCALWNFLICFCAVLRRSPASAGRRLQVSLQANLPGVCVALMNCAIGRALRLYDGLPSDVSEQAVLCTLTWCSGDLPRFLDCNYMEIGVLPLTVLDLRVGCIMDKFIFSKNSFLRCLFKYVQWLMVWWFVSNSNGLCVCFSCAACVCRTQINAYLSLLRCIVCWAGHISSCSGAAIYAFYPSPSSSSSSSLIY